MNFSRSFFAASSLPPPPPPPASTHPTPRQGRLTPPTAPPPEHTFRDSHYDREKPRGDGNGSGRGRSGHTQDKRGARRSDYENNTFGRTPTKPSNRRWSYMLQDGPETLTAALNDVNKGYLLRVAAVVGVTAGVGAMLYYGLIVPRQERKPLARRSAWLAPRVPVTLVEKNRVENSNMHLYRFSLPNSYDYAGYEPVSSVRLYSGRVRELSSLCRWYTPISHPEERGFIEFAVKDCDPGRMSSRLRYLEPGDTVYLGRWMKEFDYNKKVKEKGGEVGLVCTTAGASVALQIMQCMAREKPVDEGTGAPPPSRLQLLYCHQSAHRIPFKKDFFDKYATALPGRISVKYNVLSMGTRGEQTDPSLVVDENCFIGNLDPETLQAALPPPVRTVASSPSPSETGNNSSSTSSKGSLGYCRPQILVCGPQSMMTYLCGRVSPLSNYTYWQGWWFRYNGFLKDMGYERSQVYKFGVSTHFLAIH